MRSWCPVATVQYMQVASVISPDNRAKMMVARSLAKRHRLGELPTGWVVTDQLSERFRNIRTLAGFGASTFETDEDLAIQINRLGTLTVIVEHLLAATPPESHGLSRFARFPGPRRMDQADQRNGNNRFHKSASLHPVTPHGVLG